MITLYDFLKSVIYYVPISKKNPRITVPIKFISQNICLTFYIITLCCGNSYVCKKYTYMYIHKYKI